MASVRRNVCLRPAIAQEIDARARAAGEGFSRTIERIHEESAGNLQRARHAIRGPLNVIVLQCQLLRRPRPSDELESLASIESAAEEAAALLVDRTSV